MKDRQGIMRGKCNSCEECEEYIAPKEGARCDYCNHTPIDHVRIIKLGACKRCGPSECSEYVSGEKSSYTDCQYCGCKAMDHTGAEKLRKKPPTTSGASSGASYSQSDQCKNPGCTRPCYTEKGKKFDFCGRTCAGKYQETKGSLSSPPTAFKMPDLSQLSVAKSPFAQAEVKPLAGGKVCAKCGLQSANEGYKWCQKCFVSSKTDKKL